MNENIKFSVVVGSFVLGILFMIFGIVSVIEYCRISERNIYLEQTIEQQKELIEYLKGELINE